jgi:hypothetical protein
VCDENIIPHLMTAVPVWFTGTAIFNKIKLTVMSTKAIKLNERLTNRTKIIECVNLYRTGKYTFEQISDMLGVPKSDVIHYIFDTKFADVAPKKNSQT